MKKARGGFTLVELMVAMALMMILTGSVVFIFIQAQKIFLTVDARVQVYQYSRYAFDQMERDLANVVRSSDTEFYDDLPPPGGRVGRYDRGEEIPISGGEDNPTIYNHGFTLRQPDVYPGADGNSYRHDSIYFKTVTATGGQTSAALVEYALKDLEKERPKLVKRTWRVTGLDTTTPTRPKFQINGSVGNAAKAVEQDLCLYTIDVRFELFVRNRRTEQVGQFYDAKSLITPPRLTTTGKEPFEPSRNYWAGNDRMVQTYYDGDHDQNATEKDYGVWDENENFLFRTQRNFSFPMLREGDRIYMWGGPPGQPGMAVPKEYTIESFRKPDGTPFLPTDPATSMRIKLKEPPPDRPQSLPAGAPMLVEWDTCWLPPALRVTLRIKDSKSLQTRSVQRVFKILTN
jgi:prepilin-type N-terminal cleavage/methylation domain-containing protein